MSAVAASVTARCVHCSWRTDQDDSQALHEVREIHELIHPGGTVVVVAEPEEPEPLLSEPEPSASDGRRPRGYWTRERLIEALQAFYREQGRSPTQVDLRAPLPSNAVLTRQFGSMGKAYEAAGIPARAKGDRQVVAEPPPTPKTKGHAEGRNPPAIARRPAPREASQGTADGTLVECAERFSGLVAEIVATRARLGQLEDEARRLVVTLVQEIGR